MLKSDDFFIFVNSDRQWTKRNSVETVVFIMFALCIKFLKQRLQEYNFLLEKPIKLQPFVQTHEARECEISQRVWHLGDSFFICKPQKNNSLVTVIYRFYWKKGRQDSQSLQRFNEFEKYCFKELLNWAIFPYINGVSICA